MSAAAEDVALYGYAMAALGHGSLALYLLVSGRLRHAGKRSGQAIVAALLATTSWAVVSWLDQFWSLPGIALLMPGLDVLRYGTWFAFLLTLFGCAGTPGSTPAQRLLRLCAALITAAAAALILVHVALGWGDGLNKVEIAVALALPVCGLLMTEQVFRNLPEDSRWNAKPVCLGLGCVFAFDIYLYAEGLLFGRFDTDALSVRGAAHTLAIPFLFIAARRGSNWLGRLQVSRAAAFYSATLILAGAYLLFMAAVGYYVRFFGGNWGRALQLSLLVGALALLGMLLFSGALRSWLRVFVGKHFYSYRYDYREEWLRFTAMLSAKRSPQQMGEMVVRGLAKMVECPAGSLWTRSDGAFVQTAALNLPHVAEAEPADSPLCSFLRSAGWVIDLDEFRSASGRYGGLVLPEWLLSLSGGWLIVPLQDGDDLLGFVVLARPLTAIQLNWEVLDLLKTAARQAAGHLAQMQATEALLEARKFDAFNRMSAFVVHDLKNIVAQLSLMLKNAERLHDNREFQQDMLLTVGSSLEKMRRLMLQLREGATPAGGSHGVELAPIVRRLTAMVAAQNRRLEADASDRLWTRGHDERLERVLGHLVQNALDATPPDGRVWLNMTRHSGQVKVDVGDTGSGMSEEFVRTKLFRPFNTTKHSGMGIGSHESLQYVRELGGSITVDSRPGQGTVMTVLLPLFEVQHGSDLLRGDSA